MPAMTANTVPTTEIVASSVAAGVPFAQAFEAHAGIPPDRAAARAWLQYARWVNWIPVATSVTAVWLARQGSAVLPRVNTTVARPLRGNVAPSG